MGSELLSTRRARSPEEEARRFASIQQAVESINTVLQRCLEVDRLDHGALKQNQHDEDLSALLQHWLSRHPHRARLQADLPDALAARLDAGLLLLLGNLVDNALKYSPPDGAVHLQLRDVGVQFELAVRNAVGRAGWPDETRLFQKYYRSATAQRDSGSGLGLYWVRAVCEMLGGDVRYAREADEAVFTLVLPR
jgi:two-component system, sensor histidine kinase LadS